jgi:hypothetical protein
MAIEVFIRFNGSLNSFPCLSNREIPLLREWLELQAIQTAFFKMGVHLKVDRFCLSGLKYHCCFCGFCSGGVSGNGFSCGF